jgi:hypothetical protein
MKKQVFTLFASLLFFTYSFTILANWVKIETADYSVEFPAEPIGETQHSDSPVGSLVLDIKIYEVVENEEDDNYVYGIIFTEYPEGTIHSDNKESLKSIFDGAVNGAVENMKGKLLSQKEIEMKGFPGREFKCDFQNGVAIVTMRAYLVKNKMLSLQTICDPKKEGNAASKHFFASFDIKG